LHQQKRSLRDYPSLYRIQKRTQRSRLDVLGPISGDTQVLESQRLVKLKGMLAGIFLGELRLASIAISLELVGRTEAEIGVGAWRGGGTGGHEVCPFKNG